MARRCTTCICCGDCGCGRGLWNAPALPANLHDGAVQSLIAVEMQVDVLRRQSATRSELVPEELGRIQGLLREEVLKLRELMQQMKSLDVDSRKLIGFMADTVERFQRETGITARFSSDLEEPDMPQPLCRELTRIVQEGLVNVRKLSCEEASQYAPSRPPSSWPRNRWRWPPRPRACPLPPCDESLLRTWTAIRSC